MFWFWNESFGDCTDVVVSKDKAGNPLQLEWNGKAAGTEMN